MPKNESRHFQHVNGKNCGDNVRLCTPDVRFWYSMYRLSFELIPYVTGRFSPFTFNSDQHLLAIRQAGVTICCPVKAAIRAPFFYNG